MIIYTYAACVYCMYDGELSSLDPTNIPFTNVFVTKDDEGFSVLGIPGKRIIHTAIL